RELESTLQELLNRYKVKVSGRKFDASNGEPSSEAEIGESVGGGGRHRGNGGNNSGRRPIKRRFHPAPEGATATSDYEVFERAPKIIMLDDPTLIEEKNIKGKAASFVPETGTLFVNGLYEAIDRTVADLEPEFSGEDDAEIVRAQLITAARNAAAFR